MPNVLFLHQNFPGQYKLLAEELSLRDNFKVVALGQGTPFGFELGNVEYVGYSSRPDPNADLFPPLTFFSEQVRRGDAVRWQLMELKERGFTPDLCFVHPGWGEALFLRDVFPESKLVSYLEYGYRNSGSELEFDPEFPAPPSDLNYVSLRNLPSWQAAAVSDALVSPTRWQAGTFPPALAGRITVIHEGIDTSVAAPAAPSPVVLPSGATLREGQPLITYVARSLEPYRGFHTFMRALPRLLEILPDAHVAIVGKEPPSYGRNPPEGGTWKQRMLKEVGDDIDTERVHFFGTLPYPELINLFRRSSAHVYLTYPFVLSWSLIDAMACGCAIVASATEPVEEVIRDGENGLLADFFDHQALAEKLALVVDDQNLRQRLSKNARQTAVSQFDFKTVALPAYEKLIADLLA
ncbi:glycosyltransferase [Microvirga flavescens]|uniref:glycosyltransferase n=1 Tax=Microvirga flavescens TaxID=2249811 RepID=UPI000DDA6F4F|nr:glycosyltransferase [Microvirga flavescens]